MNASTGTGVGEAVTYSFDMVTVTTFTIRTAHGLAAARQAIASLEDYEPGQPVNAAPDADDVRFGLTCAAPRGRAYLTSAEGTAGTELIEPGSGQEDGSIPEPLTEDARAELKAALDEADEALGGDSNDAEHDALYSIRETIARLTGITYDAPSPYDEDDEAE